MGNEVAAAVVHGNVTKTTRLPNKASTFRAELHAISLALSLIRRSKEKNFIIFSDSLCQAWKPYANISNTIVVPNQCSYF